jgi:rod shape determining protein RodA
VIVDKRSIKHFDFVLIAPAIALVVYGAVLIYSASLPNYPEGLGLGHPVVKQSMFAVLGVGVMVAAAWVDYRAFGQAAVALYVLALGLLVLVLVVGEPVYGSRRWFTIAGQQVQASEIAKLLTIIVLARFMADRQHQMHDVRVFAATLALALPPALLVMMEPDMGTAMVFGAIWVGMVLMAGAPFRYVAVLVAFVVALVPFATLALLGEYQRERIINWIDPQSDPLGGGFAILQSEIGIGSGGLLGQGWTEGTQTQFHFVQTNNTDYIFSVVGEELGFLGAMILFALYIVFLFRGIRIASMTEDAFGRLVATGIVVMILFQVFINVAVNIRLLPVTGIPMPLVSQGGSSLLMLFAAIGVLEGIALRHKRLEF